MKSTNKIQNGYAVYSPMLKGVALPTCSSSRSGAIKLTGCMNQKQWKEMYRMGFKTVKVSVSY